MGKRRSKLTKSDKEKIYGTPENFNRIRKENARVKKAIRLNKELNNLSEE